MSTDPLVGDDAADRATARLNSDASNCEAR
jgi:hypothetical protein